MIAIMHLHRTLVAVLPGLMLLSIPHTICAESAVTAAVAMDRVEQGLLTSTP
jgi:hypothetical protein